MHRRGVSGTRGRCQGGYWWGYWEDAQEDGGGQTFGDIDIVLTNYDKTFARMANCHHFFLTNWDTKMSVKISSRTLETMELREKITKLPKKKHQRNYGPCTTERVWMRCGVCVTWLVNDPWQTVFWWKVFVTWNLLWKVSKCVSLYLVFVLKTFGSRNQQTPDSWAGQLKCNQTSIPAPKYFFVFENLHGIGNSYEQKKFQFT